MKISGVRSEPLFEIDKSYAGELAGWVNFRKLEGNADLFIAGFGIVGGDGASYAQEFSEADSTRFSDRVTGFEHAASLRIFSSPDKYHADFSYYDPSVRHRTDTGMFTQFSPDEMPEMGRGNWAIGATNCIEAIKSVLLSNNAKYLYPAAYYNLAGLAELPMADPEMYSKTGEIRRAFAVHGSILTKIVRVDEVMSNDLTIFGNTPASEVAEVFVAKREEVGKYEQSLSIGLPKFTEYWLTRLSDLRGFPCMDPTSTEPRAAYGMELDGLKSRHIEPAKTALDKEVAAMQVRIDQSYKIAQKLLKLSMREIEAGM